MQPTARDTIFDVRVIARVCVSRCIWINRARVRREWFMRNAPGMTVTLPRSEPGGIMVQEAARLFRLLFSHVACEFRQSPSVSSRRQM